MWFKSFYCSVKWRKIFLQFCKYERLMNVPCMSFRLSTVTSRSKHTGSTDYFLVCPSENIVFNWDELKFVLKYFNDFVVSLWIQDLCNRGSKGNFPSILLLRYCHRASPFAWCWLVTIKGCWLFIELRTFWNRQGEKQPDLLVTYDRVGLCEMCT